MLTERDYQLICKFITKIQYGQFPAKKDTNFRLQAIRMMERYFGFNKVSFLILDAKSVHNLDKPALDNVYINIPAKLYQDYYSYYYKLGIDHKQNVDEAKFNTLLKNCVYTLDDLMSSEEYEKTEYYRDFMKKYDFYYFMNIVLEYEGKYIG